MSREHPDELMGRGRCRDVPREHLAQWGEAEVRTLASYRMTRRGDVACVAPVVS